MRQRRTEFSSAWSLRHKCVTVPAVVAPSGWQWRLGKGAHGPGGGSSGAFNTVAPTALTPPPSRDGWRRLPCMLPGNGNCKVYSGAGEAFPVGLCAATCWCPAGARPNQHSNLPLCASAPLLPALVWFLWVFCCGYDQMKRQTSGESAGWDRFPTMKTNPW